MEELYNEGMAEGKAEAIIELLKDFGPVPEDTRESVMRERDLGVLKVWHKLAARAESMEDFLKGMHMS